MYTSLYRLALQNRWRRLSRGWSDRKVKLKHREHSLRSTQSENDLQHMHSQKTDGYVRAERTRLASAAGVASEACAGVELRDRWHEDRVVWRLHTRAAVHTAIGWFTKQACNAHSIGFITRHLMTEPATDNFFK